MRKKNGYLIYEMLLGFTFAFIIILNVVITITSLNTKLVNIHQKNAITSKQLIIYKKIGDDFIKYNITNVTNCTNGNIKCVNITYNSEFIRQLIINYDEKYIEYNNQRTKLPSTVKFGDSIIQAVQTTFHHIDYPNYKKMVMLKIEMTHNKNNYDIELYCTNEIDNNILTSNIF